MNVLAVKSVSSSLKVKIVRFGESPKTAARVIMSSRHEGFKKNSDLRRGLPSQPRIRACSRSFMNNAGRLTREDLSYDV
jgi:hypothetical protein